MKLKKIKKKRYIEIKNQKKEKVFDIGIAILRPILSFMVVLTHCYKLEYLDYKTRQKVEKLDRFMFHVPIFFIMAFFFSYNNIISLDYKKKIERMIRICIPYFLWPIITFFINRLLIKYSLTNSITRKIITIKELKAQFLYGEGVRSFNVFWSQLTLIVITIVFYLITFIFRKHYNLILIEVALIAYVYQYNGKYRYLLNKFREGHLVFGKGEEMIPYSVIGFLFAYSNIINYLKKNQLKVIISCLSILYFVINYPIFYNVGGHNYQGLRLFFMSLCIFISFAMFPSEKIKDKKIIQIIRQITNYTSGIYCLHKKIWEINYDFSESIRNKTFKGCIFIYLQCYVICFIGTLIFRKTKLRYLFE